MRTIWYGLAAWALLGLAGCSRILGLPGDPEYVERDENDSATMPMGGTMSDEPEDETWGCLANGSSGETEPSDTSVPVKLKICSFLKPDCAEPLEGFTADLCAKIDVKCSNPLMSDVPLRKGAFEFSAQTGDNGFDGYLRIRSESAMCMDEDAFGDAAATLCAMLPECDLEAPDEACQFPLYPESMFFFNPPLFRAEDGEHRIDMIPSTAVSQLVQAGGGSDIDTSSGFLFITANDCRGRPASGVSFHTNRVLDGTQKLYIAAGIISPTATTTDESGLGGLAGVPPGFVQVTGMLADGKAVGSAGVQIAPFSITYVNIAP